MVKQASQSRAATDKAEQPRDSPAGALAYAPPLSVSRPALLDAGRDDRFREMIYGLFTAGARFGGIREAFGREIGITGAQYFVLIATAHHAAGEGIGIRTLADYLHVASSHVTTEVGKLVRAGLLAKRANPNDGRGVLVSVTEKGRAGLALLAPFRQAVNDILFRDLSRHDFSVMAEFIGKFIASTEAAVDYIETHHQQRKRAAKARQYGPARL
ncbi:MAG: MarR family winged helix-turn-helix transcriptional regulator [Alphaproteobacteria bacterium]